MQLRRRIWRIGVAIGIGFTVLIANFSPTYAQRLDLPTNLPRLEVPEATNSSPFTNSDIVTGAITLDGRRLFTIAVPAAQTPSSQNSNRTTPIELRIQGIEATLNRLVNRGVDPATLNVQATIDSNSNLPVISVNQQYLMTVTTLDAQPQGQEPATFAQELTQIIREALIRSQQERQPDFLTRQGVTAVGIVLGMLLLSWGLSRLQRQLKRQQDRIDATKTAEVNISPNISETANSNTQITVQQQLRQRQYRNSKEVQRRLLQLAQLGIWGFGSFTILGLFPYTRWLQPVVLSTPLKVIGIISIVYILIRFSDVIIDRIFSALEISDETSPVTSQRLALRISTFSRVVKGLSAFVWIGIAATSILAVIGIEVVPLLAGAGILGLAISLASQNLIRDVINGLLILLEDQYAVGDVIQVGSASGLVEHLSLRITQLRNAEGRLITLPNSTIGVVENLSKDWSRVDLAIAVSYDADVDRAIEVIADVGAVMRQEPQWQTKILEPPEVLGVDDLNNTGVTLRIWIKTQPLQQWKVGREFRRRLKIAFDEQGIAIGVPQQAFSLRGAPDDRAFEETDERRNSRK